MNGVLSPICGIALLLFIPESPKFTFFQGDDEKTMETLVKIQKWNSGDSFEISCFKRELHEPFVSNSKKNFFKFVWMQTVPILKGTHLKNLLCSGYLLFAACFASNGFLSFFPEIINKTFLWIEKIDNGVTICDIFNTNYTNDSSKCVEYLENEVFISIIAVVILHIVGYCVCSYIIDKFSKKYIIAFIAFIAGICPILIAVLEMPNISVYLYSVMITNSVNMQVINASTFERFPTSMR
jgi:hypothetical protein